MKAFLSRINVSLLRKEDGLSGSLVFVRGYACVHSAYTNGWLGETMLVLGVKGDSIDRIARANVQADAVLIVDEVDDIRAGECVCLWPIALLYMKRAQCIYYNMDSGECCM